MSPFQFSSLTPKELRFITKALAPNPKLLNASVPTVGAIPRKVMFSMLLQFSKALVSIAVTLAGIKMSVRLMQA